MKALTLWQPWASLIAHGVKTIETRSWPTKYRGPLAIHAAKQRFGADKIGWDSYIALALKEVAAPLPLGAVVATCELVDVVPTSGIIWNGSDGGTMGQWVCHHDMDGDAFAVVRERQRPYGDFTPGRFAWLLDNIKPCHPIPATGHQGLWNWEAQ